MQLKIIGVLLLIIAMAGGGFYWYFHYSQGQLATLQANNAKLQVAQTISTTTINNLKSDAIKLGNQLTTVNNRFNTIQQERDRLTAILAKHNLGYLAYKKPVLVENIVNKATDQIGRCFEILSGSPLTAKEKGDTGANSIKNSCSNVTLPTKP